MSGYPCLKILLLLQVIIIIIIIIIITFNAARSRHSGDWLMALYVACSLATRRSESQLEPGWL